jgi:alpha-galactosidase
MPSTCCAVAVGPSGNWTDPDMLVVGRVGWGRPHPTRLTPDEQYTHISLLTNDEVLAVDQDEMPDQVIAAFKL